MKTQLPITIPWRRILLILSYIVLFTAIVWTVRWEHVPPNSFSARLNRILRGNYFDFLSWEAKALLDKIGQELTTPQHYLDDATRKQLVLDYLDLVARIHRLEGEITYLYTDPNIADPDTESAAQRAELTQLRTRQADLQKTVEAIIEEQIASILEEEGLAVLGQVVPPVRFHFTPLPNYLVISPRTEIRLAAGAMLRGDLGIDHIETLERQIDETLDVSSLIVPIGGLAIYPAMLDETSSLYWGISSTAHEWVHHYFFFWLKPVGIYYESRPDVRTINESSAELVGDAVRDRVLARYYPEFLPEPTLLPNLDVLPSPEPPAFNYMSEMRETRITADRLLADGKVEEAEAYMEQRRRVFVEQGYLIRKLNQAYFAFYGAYDAATPSGGTAGINPIGDPVQELWAASPTIKSFLDAIGPITSREMLLDLLAKKGIEFPPTSGGN